MNVKERIAAHEARLMREHRGTLVGGADLRNVLGFKTGAAFRQAVHQGRIPVPTFVQAGRRDRFARVHDLAVWLAHLDATIDQDSPNHGIRTSNEEKR